MWGSTDIVLIIIGRFTHLTFQYLFIGNLIIAFTFLIALPIYLYITTFSYKIKDNGLLIKYKFGKPSEIKWNKIYKIVDGKTLIEIWKNKYGFRNILIFGDEEILKIIIKKFEESKQLGITKTASS